MGDFGGLKLAAFYRILSAQPPASSPDPGAAECLSMRFAMRLTSYHLIFIAGWVFNFAHGIQFLAGWQVHCWIDGFYGRCDQSAVSIEIPKEYLGFPHVPVDRSPGPEIFFFDTPIGVLTNSPPSID